MHALVATLSLLVGETLIVGVEMYIAKYFGESDRPWFLFWSGVVLACVGVVLLLYGYAYIYQLFKNIWIATALTISGILVVEPLLAILLFKQMPTLGAGIAFVLGIIGTLIAIVVK